MAKIEVRKPTPEELKKLGVESWPSWGCEVSEFDWHYDDTETCYFLEGKVIVETAEGSVEINAGDLVVFPAGLSCKWKVLEPVKKVYSFSAEL